MNFKPRPIGELNHPFEKLGSPPGVLRTIVEIHDQTSDATESVSNTCPPRTQAIAPKVTRFVIAKQQRQRPGHQNQNAERNQLFLSWRIVVPAFGDVTITVGSRFFPPTRIHPN